MQLFTILILVTLPIVFVQFFSARLPLFMSQDEAYSPTVEALYEQVTVSESNQTKQQFMLEEGTGKQNVALQQKALFLLHDEMEGSGYNTAYSDFIADDLSEENAIIEPESQKKVQLVRGKQHVHGMEFLSVILMLKEKQK